MHIVSLKIFLWLFLFLVLMLVFVVRKRNDSESSTKSSRPRSLSPLSKKMAQQEGQWQPPPNINTTSSYLSNTSVSSIGVGVPGQDYTYSVANWQSSTVAPNVGMVGSVPACYVPPPTAYQHFPVQGEFNPQSLQPFIFVCHTLR